jgi:hypothetical protein
MFRLEYWIGNSIIEYYVFPNKVLSLWKRKSLINQGTHSMGTFKINKV